MIEFADGTALREESNALIARIKAGTLGNPTPAGA